MAQPNFNVTLLVYGRWMFVSAPVEYVISQEKDAIIKGSVCFKYLFKSIRTQLSASVPFPFIVELSEFRPLNEQFGLNVASSMAIVESKLLHVNRISESWHPHSSTTSVKLLKWKLCHLKFSIWYFVIAITTPKSILWKWMSVLDIPLGDWECFIFDRRVWGNWVSGQPKYEYSGYWEWHQ